MKISLLETKLAICRLEPNESIPEWAIRGKFFSINKTEDELSVVCDQENIPDDIKSEKDWKAFKVEGPLDFGLTGVLASIANPLAYAKISIFAISTFDTDYVLVRSHDVEAAKGVLKNSGFVINDSKSL